MSSLLEWAGVVAASGGVGSLLTKALSRRQDNADIAKVFVDAATALVAPLEARLSVVEAENGVFKTRLQLAIDHIQELRSWIYTHLPTKSPPPMPTGLGL